MLDALVPLILIALPQSKLGLSIDGVVARGIVVNFKLPLHEPVVGKYVPLSALLNDALTDIDLEPSALCDTVVVPLATHTVAPLLTVGV